MILRFPLIRLDWAISADSFDSADSLDVAFSADALDSADSLD